MGEAFTETSEVEWKYSENWTVGKRPLTDITACTVDPYGQVLIVGSGDGRFAFVCVQTGFCLPYKYETTDTFKCFDGCRIQAISCALYPYNIAREKYRLLCALGTVSGLFQVFISSIKRNRAVAEADQRSHFQLAKLHFLETLAPHSFNQEIYGIGVRGGTLCVCTQETVAVSGGGNGRCCLVMLFSNMHPGEDTVTDFIEDLGAPVTKVTAEQKIIAVGLANGNIRVYSCGPLRPHEQLATIDTMTNSPVTALAWGMCKELHTMHHMLLAVGGLDQRIRTYLIHAGGRTTLFEQLEGPGGPVVDLQIRDRFVVAGTLQSKIRLWRLSDSAQCTTVRTIDMPVRNRGFTVKRLMGLTLFFDNLLRPLARIFPVPVPEVIEENNQTEQSSDNEDVTEPDEPNDNMSRSDSQESLLSKPNERLIYVNPSSESEPLDSQVRIIICQSLTHNSPTGVHNPLRFCVFREF